MCRNFGGANWPCKLSFSADPVILDLKVKLVTVKPILGHATKFSRHVLPKKKSREKILLIFF